MKRFEKVLILIFILALGLTTFASCGKKAANDLTKDEVFEIVQGEWEQTYYYISGASKIIAAEEFLEGNGYLLGIKFDSIESGALLVSGADGSKVELPFTWGIEKGPIENLMFLTLFDVAENEEEDYFPEKDCFSLKIAEKVLLWEDDTTSYFFGKK